MKKSVYYWSPCLTRVGTVKSTLNSAISLAKYSKLYNVKILNVFGEWSNYKKILEENNIKLENLTFNYYNLLPKNGYLKSRISYILIILISFVPLMFFLKKKKNRFFYNTFIDIITINFNEFIKLKNQYDLKNFRFS